MPILTNTHELCNRARLHRPVYDGTQLLLPAGKVLNSADIDFLRKRCPGASVYIEDPVLDELVAFEDDSHDCHVAHTTQKKLIGLLSDVEERFASRMSVKTMDCQGIESAVEGVLKYLTENPVVAMRLIEPEEGQHYLVSHPAHVFYLSLVMGNAVRVRVERARQAARRRHDLVRTAPDLDLAPLALSALFMDLGMWEMKELYEQSEPMTAEQCEFVRGHPARSTEMLPEETDELVKLVIETHHENYDGTGYPYGLCGEEIHIFARILRIADAYAAATSAQVYKEAYSPVRALWEMTFGSLSHFYDPVLLKIFANLVQPFPIGATLRLGCGRYGVVVRYGTLSPFLPEIVVAFDKNGERLPADLLEGPIKMHERPEYEIVSFQGEDLRDLYTTDTKLQPVTSSEFTTLFESMCAGCATTRSV